MKKAHYSGVLTRLAKNQAGNVMPILGFAIFPMAAMIGGAVDASRLYMTKTRLQNACDAGALAVRKSMSGATPTDANKAVGEKFFDVNFSNTMFGVTNVTRSFAGAGSGTVNGTATAQLPATVMRIFDRESFDVTVTCSSTLNVPNTDVVFVLDVSGSMNQAVSGTDSTKKIDGLKDAVKAFYGALGAGSSGADTPGRIRYGFVPYATNVNVGNLLDNNWMPTTAPYRTRIPTISQVWTYTLGAQSGLGSWSAFSPSTMPTTYNTASGFGGRWSRLGSTPSSTINVGGTNYRYRHATYNTSATCTNANVNTLSGSGNTLAARSDTAGSLTASSLQSTTNNPPTYVPASPPTQQVLTYGRSEPHTVTGYRYRWQAVSSVNGCWLESNPETYSKNQTATATKSITWTQRDRVTGWTYGTRNIDISGLKAGGSNWNTSLTVPQASTSSLSVYLSGSSSSTNINLPANGTFTWRGCIEEANSDNTILATSPLDIPVTAYDMQIDLNPDTDAKRWKPHLAEFVWDSGTQHSNSSDVCVTAASKLTQYLTVTNFNTYVDSLTPNGNTQHDIGMIWGARMLSPDGIYASTNSDASAPGGYQISRHLVFMTDGLMNAQVDDYGPWGIARLDGRQVPTTQLDANSGSEDMNNKHYRRMEMICNAARAKGYTIWVVGFGMATLPDALVNCASSPDHASVATSTADLTEQFENIADTIGGLRLSL